MSLENGVSEQLRSGFVLTCTNSTDQQEWHGNELDVMFEAPEADLADVFVAQGIIKFFEEATGGTLRMILVFARSTYDYFHEHRE